MATPPGSVGAHLATRLVQLGVGHLFGLPGDFNLALLDEMLPVPGLEWVGSTNELNAAYAADGYARVGRRVGAFVTTYGVGELSAVNGIAGSYAEDVPVVHVVGMPSRTAMAAGAPLHHTFLDGDFRRFERVFREVTAAQTVLEPHNAVAEIDRVLRAALETSKPVYIGVPADVATAAPGAGSVEPLVAPAGDPAGLEQFRAGLAAHLQGHDDVCLLAGPRVHRRGLEHVVAGLAELPGVRVASQSGSKALVDEEHRASLGTYLGATTRSDAARATVDDARLLVMAGTVHSDFTTGFFTHRYDREAAVELAIDHARIGRAVYPRVRLEDSLQVLHELVEAAGFPPAPPVELAPSGHDVPGDDDEPLDQARFWSRLQGWIAPRTTLVAEAGTAFYGALDLSLPAESDLLGQPIWSSIGFTLPATLGAALARPDRRPVLVIGDGSAQLTAQELGTLYARAPDAIVLLLNNDGYTVERAIQSPDAVYQDITAWDWTRLPAALGAPDVHAVCARTVGELRAALDHAGTPGTAAFVEVVLPPKDVPRLLLELARGLSTTGRAAFETP